MTDTHRGTVIGLDIGGTKTRGIRIEDGTVTDVRTTGSTNTQNVPVEQAARRLGELLTALGAGEAGRVIVGAGGIDTEADAEHLRRLIAPHSPHSDISVIHDTRLILAAGGADTGIAIISGTGSAVWGVNAAGRTGRAGGWGYLLGDEGSGYWFGREAVRYSMDRANRGQDIDLLTRGLLDYCGLTAPEELISLFHGTAGRHYWADTSRLVFDTACAGHSPSLAIIDSGANHLAGQAATVAARIGMTGPVVLGGGLVTNQQAFQQSITDHLKRRDLTDIRFLAQEPVYGVLQLARDKARA
ncbi:N-acetylglucosamine kinase [Pseudarthrobacter sp. 1C304]|uniref:N-acetylglucosamine kinase n=1 Tax=Pseudarthrobacter sp. 1C304 TaxID=3457438 RepID=UPI003FD2528E